MPVELFDLAADLARAQASGSPYEFQAALKRWNAANEAERQAAIKADTLAGQCPWCAAICGHEPFCSVYDNPLTVYHAGKCPECKGDTLHAEDCPNVERDVKFIRRGV